jgi:hypothetical protein
VSATEIIEELEKLKPEERKAIARRALELNWSAAEREAIEFAEAASAQLAQFIDQDEAACESR